MRPGRLGLLTAAVGFSDRECVGYRFSCYGRANEAIRPWMLPVPLWRGLLRGRGGPAGSVPDQDVLPLPKGTAFTERFFRSLKEECVWQHRFTSFAGAEPVVAAWIRFYNEEPRPLVLLGGHYSKHVPAATHGAKFAYLQEIHPFHGPRIGFA